VAGQLGPGEDFGDKASLPDTRFALDHDDGRGFGDRREQPGELGVAADEVGGRRADPR
jgi:hypothetical protein